MRVVGVILAFFVGLALAGVDTLAPWEEDQKLELFSKLCLSDAGAENGQKIDGAWIFCKRSPQGWTQENVHEVHKNLESGHQQEIFVQPPSLELSHRVTVNAGLQGGITKVYVIPNQVKNKYEVDVRGQTDKLKKPKVYFLKDENLLSIPVKSGYVPQQPPPDYPKEDAVQYPLMAVVVPR